MLFAIIVIFRERRDVGSTWAWLLVLFFIPVLGFALYMLLGQNLSRYRLFQWKYLNKTGITEMLTAQFDQIGSHQYEFGNQVSQKHRELVYMHLINNNALLTEDNQVELFTDGHKKFEQLFKDIEGAKDHIHLQYYIIKKDTLGIKLIEALTRKAITGVKVRILYDDLGSRGLPKRLFKELIKAGGEVEVFFPTKFRFINLRLNYRNHRKLVIIDGKIGYMGGLNVGNEYLGLNPKFGYWRDNHLKIQGTAVRDIQTRFILDWNQAAMRDIYYDPRYFPKNASPENVGLQIVTSGPDSEWEQIKNGYIKMISSAKQSVLIQTPYFIPDSSILDALRIACLSGIEVKIMIPNKPDHLFVYWATLSYIGQLLKAGATVYIYENGFVHAKTLIVDQEVASVGTANIDIRSFKLNFEVNAFIYDLGIAKQLTKAFNKDVEKSKLLTVERYEQRSLWVRFKENISRLLSPIL